MIRDDLSDKLIHLTRGESEKEAADKFLSIVNNKVLLGGTGLIRGGFHCVCFSEAPIAKLSHILANPSIHGIRYAPLGVMIDKLTLFQAGGRPVIYQPEAEYELLHESQRFRHQRYEPDKAIDFSWEREWRIPTDGLSLDPHNVTLVVPNRSWAEHFHRRHADELRGAAMIMEDLTPFMIEKCPWHFIVLEDLGVDVNFDCVPPK